MLHYFGYGLMVLGVLVGVATGLSLGAPENMLALGIISTGTFIVIGYMTVRLGLELEGPSNGNLTRTPESEYEYTYSEE